MPVIFHRPETSMRSTRKLKKKRKSAIVWVFTVSQLWRTTKRNEYTEPKNGLIFLQMFRSWCMSNRNGWASLPLAMRRKRITASEVCLHRRCVLCRYCSGIESSSHDSWIDCCSAASPQPVGRELGTWQIVAKLAKAWNNRPSWEMEAVAFWDVYEYMSRLDLIFTYSFSHGFLVALHKCFLLANYKLWMSILCEGTSFYFI